MKRDKATQIYSNGETVKCVMDGYNLLTIVSAKWNGFTFMYSFLETQMRCGEDYLRRVK